jgi:hypothetical protein
LQLPALQLKTQNWDTILQIDVIMESFNATSRQYISNNLLSLTDANPGLLAVIVVFFDFNSTVSVTDIEDSLVQYFNR